MRENIAIPLTLTAISALCVGVFATVLLTPTPTPSGLGQSSEPTQVVAQPQSFDDERTVGASFTTTPEQTLTARASGTISETNCRAGSHVNSGDVLMRVNDAPVVALFTSTPLYRDIRLNDSGPDVAALQQELSRLGFAADGNGIYGRLTASGVNALLSQAGAAKPNGVIGPGNIIWLPSPSVTAAQCLTGLNANISGGTDVVKIGGELTAVTYTPPSGLYAGKRTFALFGITIANVDPNGRITDHAFLSKIQTSDGYKAALADTSGKKPAATLSLGQPINAIKVPPSAIFGQQGNRACVSTRARSATQVTIVGSALGATLIEPVARGSAIGKVLIGHITDGIACPATQGTSQ